MKRYTYEKKNHYRADPVVSQLQTYSQTRIPAITKYLDLKLIRLLLAIGLWLSACNSGNSRRSIPLVTESPVLATPALASQVITAENVASLVEVRQLVVDNAGPVAALAFTPDLQMLLAAYAHEGSLRHWALTNGTLLTTLKLNSFGLGGVSFDVGAKFLATSAGVEWEAHKSEKEYRGFWVWDAQTGRVTKEAFTDGAFLYPNIQLSRDGRWVLHVGIVNYSVFQNDKSVTWEPVIGSGSNTLYEGEDSIHADPEEHDFDVLAIDSQEDFFAVANEAGKIAIYPFNKSISLIDSKPVWIDDPYTIIESGDIEALGPTPLALAFDPTRHWLARVRGTELVVWDLQLADYKRQLEAPVGQTSGITASLAFNPGGELLGVGTVNGWQIWNVKTGEQIVSGTDAEVYAVTFSSDGRLFVWGDASGVVHVWGVPSSE